jgi:anaerobic selenocysteine-containing dehydrogenase
LLRRAPKSTPRAPGADGSPTPPSAQRTRRCCNGHGDELELSLPPKTAELRRHSAPIDATALEIRADAGHPSNLGRICLKGATLADTLGLEDRLLHPEIAGRRASWDEALEAVARGFEEAIAAHGPDAVAFYVSGQLLTEDYYAANKLMKGFIGGANIDTNSRLCMASAVAERSTLACSSTRACSLRAAARRCRIGPAS